MSTTTSIIAGVFGGSLLVFGGIVAWDNWVRLARIDTIAHPRLRPQQTDSVVITGRPARGANLRNLRGAARLPAGWVLVGHALVFDVEHRPRLLLEEGGPPMPRVDSLEELAA